MRLFLAAALTALIVCLLGHQTIGQDRQPNTDTTAAERQKAAKSKNDIPQLVVQSQPAQEPTEKQNATTQNTKHPYLPSPEWISAISAVLILLVTTAYVLVSYCTLQQIRKGVKPAKDTAEAAKRNAEAAKLNAQAIINADRAWIGAAPVLNHRGPHTYSLEIVNYGRTPARIVSFGLSYWCIPLGFTGLPDTAGDTIEVREYYVMLPPGPPEPLSNFDIKQIIGDAWEDVTSENKIAVFRWFVTYRDIVTQDGEPHKTAVCYAYHAKLDGTPRLWEQPQYNIYT